MQKKSSRLLYSDLGINIAYRRLYFGWHSGILLTYLVIIGLCVIVNRNRYILFGFSAFVPRFQSMTARVHGVNTRCSQEEHSTNLNGVAEALQMLRYETWKYK